MRAAPAVSVQCTGGRGWRLAQVVLVALAGAAAAAWAAGHAGLAVPLPALLAGAAAGAVAWRRCRPAAVQLVWDGQRWTADGAAVRPEPMIDTEGWLLLRLHRDGGGSRWIAAARGEAGAAWHGLRTALYARPGAGG